MAEKQTMEPVAKFVSLLLHARTSAHILHLQTRSYAQHMALGGLYESIGGLADDFVEAFQGLYGIIEEYPSGFVPPARDALAEVVAFGRSVKTMRRQIPQDSELQNIIDEIASLIDGTIYKLRFLA